MRNPDETTDPARIVADEAQFIAVGWLSVGRLLYRRCEREELMRLATNETDGPARILTLIEQHRLLVRPTVLGGWMAGRFLRVTWAHAGTDARGTGMASVFPETYTEADTLEEAVVRAAEKAAALEAGNA